jgi:hypothetical protein
MENRTIDAELLDIAKVLREKAASLRAQAVMLSVPLASAYRRRASELELEAWISEVQGGAPEHRLQVA